MKNKNIFKWLYLFCTLFILSVSSVQAQINPLLLKDEAEIYPLVYFGMSLDEFKQKLSTRIFECKPNPNKTIADSGCKISFRFAGSGMSEGIGLFKSGKMVAFIARINTDFYQAVTQTVQSALGGSPQMESRGERKGFFSSKIENEYSIWSYPNYQMIISKFDIQRYEENGANFSLIIESDNTEFNSMMKEQSRKRSDIQIRTAEANAPIGKAMNTLVTTETQQVAISSAASGSNVTAAQSTPQGTIYSDPSLDRLFSNRPVDTSTKSDITRVLDDLHSQYLNKSDVSVRNKLVQDVKSQEPSLPTAEVEEKSNQLIGNVSECLTRSAMAKLEVFKSGSLLPGDVLTSKYFLAETEICSLHVTVRDHLDRINRNDAKRRLANMKSVNDILLNGSKYDRAIYVSGFFLYEHNDASLLLHSRDNINRIYVNTINLKENDKRKLMECSLGCNLQFLGRVDTYRRQYIINAIQVFDAPN